MTPTLKLLTWPDYHSPESLRGRPHDPEGTISVTKDWGTTGFMYRTDQVAERPRSWADFWRLAEQNSSQVSVRDSQAEVIGAALKKRGHFYNAEDPASLADAREDLLRLRPHVGHFETGYRPLVESGEVVLALGWNGDAAALLAAGLPVGYVTPEEGSQIWEVDWAIAANAANPEAAHAFIDYQLRPEVAAREAAYTRYATPNARNACRILAIRSRHLPGSRGALQAGVWGAAHSQRCRAPRSTVGGDPRSTRLIAQRRA